MAAGGYGSGCALGSPADGGGNRCLPPPGAFAGDTTGNSPATKWVACKLIAEHLDYGRRYTSRTNQVQRSFEDVALKQWALDLVLAT
jgi:hypothetical protein